VAELDRSSASAGLTCFMKTAHVRVSCLDATVISSDRGLALRADRVVLQQENFVTLDAQVTVGQRRSYRL
jgi:hypothetical protein